MKKENKAIKLTGILLCLVLLLSCLAGCGAKDLFKEMEREPEPTATPEPTPTPTPAPTPTPTPTPKSVFEEEGPALYINAVETETFLYNGLLYVPFSAYMTACGFEYASDDKGADFTFRGADYRIEYADSLLTKEGEKVSLEAAAILDLGRLYVPVGAFSRAIGVSEYTDTETGLIYYTPGAGAFEITCDRRVPVLMYHGVTDDLWGIAELFVSPSSMEEQLAYLAENGYTTIFFEDLWNLENIEKPVILSFDDSYSDNYYNLFPLLKKYNQKATIFCISGWMGDPDGLYLNYEQAKEMSDSGLVSIQSHGFSHRRLGELGENDVVYEMDTSKRMLTRITGREPYVLCYPEGSYGRASMAVAPEYYSFAIKMNGGIWSSSGDPFLVDRVYIPRSTSIQTFASYIDVNG